MEVKEVKWGKNSMKQTDNSFLCGNGKTNNHLGFLWGNKISN